MKINGILLDMVAPLNKLVTITLHTTPILAELIPLKHLLKTDTSLELALEDYTMKERVAQHSIDIAACQMVG